MATVDASLESTGIHLHPSKAIDEEVLKRLEVNMDTYERISSLFLIIEDYKLGYKTFTAYGSDASKMISNFIRDNVVVDWKSKVVEAICLVQNHEILLNLGIHPEEARVIFATDNSELPCKVNKYARAFYHLFEDLSSNDVRKLLERVYMKERVTRPNLRTWPDSESLEIHMLWWIHEGFVEISEDKWNLKRILKVLKALELTKSDAYETLTKYDSENVDPCRYDKRSNSIRSEMNNVIEPHNRMADKYEVSNGLAIVFNQIRFPDWTEYDYRYGSERDCELIKQTFEETFGFDVKINDDYSKEKIYDDLDSLRVSGKNYDCVFVFILSHGKRGFIIASDGLECSIENIREKICCDALLGKPKVLVIQACQSQDLTKDGPAVSCLNVRRFEDFLSLSSTIPGEQSVRHPKEGTWYIQTLCKVLIKGIEKHWCIDDCTREVNRIFNEKEGEVDGKRIGQVPKRDSTMGKKLVLPIRMRRIAESSSAEFALI